MIKYSIKIPYKKKVKNESKNKSNFKVLNSEIATENLNKCLDLYRKGKMKRALKVLNKAIEYNPTNDSYYYIKIYFLYKMKKYKKIAEAYDRLIELYPECVSFYRDKSSLFLRELKDYKEALRIVDKGLSIDPKNEDLIFSKIKILELLGRFQEILEIIINFNPKNPNFYHMYI